MAAAKKKAIRKVVDAKGRKLRIVDRENIAKGQRVLKKADKRKHAERYNYTHADIAAIARRMLNDGH